MGVFADKLNYLNDTKMAIKNAIGGKGTLVSETDTFRSYAAKIEGIESFSRAYTRIQQPTADQDYFKNFLDKDVQTGQGNKKILFLLSNNYIPIDGATDQSSHITGTKLYDGTFYTYQEIIDMGHMLYQYDKYYSRCNFSLEPVYIFIVYFDDTTPTITQFNALNGGNYICSKNINIDYSAMQSGLTYFDMIDCKVVTSGTSFQFNAAFPNKIINSDYLQEGVYASLESSPVMNIEKLDFSLNPMYIDPSTPTIFDSGVKHCPNIIHFPTLNLSTVTDLTEFFFGCSSLESVDLFNTSNVTNMTNMFEDCAKLKSVPLFNTSNVTNMSYMFQNCSTLKTIPLLDTAKVTGMASMFYNCTSLVSVPAIDLSSIDAVGTNGPPGLYAAFDGCTNIESILCINIAASFDISASEKFTREALLVVINNLSIVSAAQTLTIGAINLAKLTADDIAIATAKNWTIN